MAKVTLKLELGDLGLTVLPDSSDSFSVLLLEDGSVRFEPQIQTDEVVLEFFRPDLVPPPRVIGQAGR